MATPKCSCGSTNFIETARPSTFAGRDLLFVHCAKCGLVVGVVEQASVINLLAQVAKKLGVPGV